jgi:hypothetical protein
MLISAHQPAASTVNSPLLWKTSHWPFRRWRATSHGSPQPGACPRFKRHLSRRRRQSSECRLFCRALASGNDPERMDAPARAALLWKNVRFGELKRAVVMPQSSCSPDSRSMKTLKARKQGVFCTSAEGWYGDALPN